MQSGGQCGHLIIDCQDLRAMLHEPGAKLRAEPFHPIERDGVQQTFGERQQQRHLLAERDRCELMLSEDGADAAAMFDHLTGAFIDHGPEAGKYFEFKKLSIVEPQALRRCLEDGGLCLGADARDALANIDRRFLIFVKKTRVEVDLVRP